MAKVKIYTTDTCVFCHQAKEYFKEKGIEYEEINLSENSDKVQELFQISGGMGVPVIIIEGRVIRGFDREQIDEALGM